LVEGALFSTAPGYLGAEIVGVKKVGSRPVSGLWLQHERPSLLCCIHPLTIGSRYV